MFSVIKDHKQYSQTWPATSTHTVSILQHPAYASVSALMMIAGMTVVTTISSSMFTARDLDYYIHAQGVALYVIPVSKAF